MKTPAWVSGIVTALALGLPAAITAAPANDNFANRITATGTNFTATVNNSGATSESGEPAHAGSAAIRSVWWSWTAPQDMNVFVTTGGSTSGIGSSQLDTLLAVYTGGELANLAPVVANDDGNPNAGIVTSRVEFQARAGATYQIAVDTVGGVTGNIRLSMNPNAPSWACTNLMEQLVASTNFAGKVLMVNFWATYCSHCRAEIPDFIALQNKYQNDGLMVIGLSVDTTAISNIINFVTTNGMSYPVLLANLAVRTNFGGISGTPTTFVIDRNNILRERIEGTRTRAAWESMLKPLLYDRMNVQARAGAGQIFLAWPTNEASFTLQYSSSLPPTNWIDTASNPQVFDGMNTLQIPILYSNRFYRLRLSN